MARPHTRNGIPLDELFSKMRDRQKRHKLLNRRSWLIRRIERDTLEVEEIERETGGPASQWRDRANSQWRDRAKMKP